MPKKLPSHTQVVVIGGGIIGCSVAYHLTRCGVRDVVLLERKKLTCGTSWAAAGLLLEFKGTLEVTRMIRYGLELYSWLEEETEQPTGFIKTGSLLLATSEDRRREYELMRSMAKTFGVEFERVTPAEVSKMWPVLNTNDVLAGYYTSTDGVVNPVDATMSLAKGARMGGAGIFEETKVTDFELKNGSVCAVKTDRGDLKCEYVVLCTGMWSRDLAKKIGVTVPLHAVEHLHFVTEPIEGVYKGMPILRDMDGHLYYREEVGGLLIGALEPEAKPWGTKGIPEEWMFRELNTDLEHLEPLMEKALERVPALENTPIRHFTTVPESFTSDNLYILGEAPGLKRVYVASGMNTNGIMVAPGVGKRMAEWITQGYPEKDLWELDVRRFYSWQSNKNYLRDRIVEIPGNGWAIHWPYKQLKTARPVRRSVIHDRLAGRGACFGQLAGWERANWFAPEGVEPKNEYSWGRQNWFEYSAAEHMAVRNGVGIYDLSFMGNFLLQGSDALGVLQKLCANNMDVPFGKVVYTQMLNERGGIEADITVTRLAEDKFFIVAGAPTVVRDFDWIDRHIPKDAHAILTDVSSAYTALGVMGPNSRELLSRVTDADLSNESFPFSTSKEIELGYASPLALRISFVGELGWELYLPPDFAVGVFDALMEAGQELGLKLIGLHAIDSLRLERGFCHWGADIGPDDTPLEAGLGFAVKMNKGHFIGREALMKQKENGLSRKLVTFTLEDPEPLIYHDEPIYRNGVLSSGITHGAYAHFLGCAIGMGYLENQEGIADQWIQDGEYQVEVEDELVPAKVHLTSPYDAKGARVRM